MVIGHLTGYLTYKSFSKNFNNITTWQNLTVVKLPKNEITVLPSAFGKLSLRVLNLSQNWLGKVDSTKWLWMEQSAIQNSLIALDISDNFLRKLPSNIVKLNCLLSLNISNNLLERLPYNIGNMCRLVSLNMSCNRLLYLPATIMYLKLHNINILMNPLLTSRCENKYKVLSLFELSANTILQCRIPYSTRLPSRFVALLEETNRCFICARIGIGFVPIYINDFIYNINTRIIFHTIEDGYVIFEFYCCPSLCQNNSDNRSVQHIDNLISKLQQIVRFKYTTRTSWTLNIGRTL